MSVLVYTENWDGKFKKQSYELVSYAAGVAGMTGGSVTALSIGKVEQDELSKLGAYGATSVLNAESAPDGENAKISMSVQLCSHSRSIIIFVLSPMLSNIPSEGTSIKKYLQS